MNRSLLYAYFTLYTKFAYDTDKKHVYNIFGEITRQCNYNTCHICRKKSIK